MTQLLTPVGLIAFRLYLITFGRLPLFSRLLRYALLRTLVTSRQPGERYVAASRYFRLEELAA